MDRKPVESRFSMRATAIALAGLLVALAPTLAPSAAVAQAEDNAQKVILVLDASGSMWGQIDGEAKITIARRAIDDLLDTLPASTQLGLTVYGHREKGNCDDIETLVVPGAQPRSAIRQAIAAISPKGKTPLSKAVLLAAEALKYEENKATVILLSDGIETCNYDPCTLGAQLEADGVDFTAHVIGFDVAEPAARAQLQCLAANTGGRFLTADTANELAAALQEVSVAPAPEQIPAPEQKPAMVDAVFEATDGEGGPVIKSGLVWTLTLLETGAKAVDALDIGVLRMPVEPGTYRAEVRRQDGVSAELEATIRTDGNNSFVLPLVLDLPDATLSAAGEAPQGATIPVAWSGPDENQDYIAVAELGAKGGDYINYTYTKTGNPLQLQMPPTPGSYEIRYVMNQDNRILASIPITVSPVEASVSTVSRAPAGSEVIVTWIGPDENRDYIAVAEVSAKGGTYINYTYTERGNPVKLKMPTTPGDYEVRYILNQDNTILARQPISVEQD
ncbi:VWA domain-containing protein [Hoeflea sp.]|uniref:VWA domain-containing protein n=1 Tax=Hoeflea sp. TaxID=1940281 RepID=UPI0019A7E84F|nr:VWA domain-containing protein [Hoeflea sp.]MBC7285336.1 VWA domain-containing protein [Hoeflea sp.]